jgi:uncharacterized protein with HEPN domain
VNVENRRAQDAASRVLTVCGIIAQIVESGEEHFLHDVQAQWAAEMGLIRIGEAVAKIPASVRERFAGQPWRQIIDLRSVAAHQDDDLDPRRVWRTLTGDVPRLRDYLNDVMLPALSAGPRS